MKDQILQLISSRPSLNASGIAKELNLSYFHFFHTFKKLFGEPPQKYILKERVKLAKQLAKNEKLSAKEVAFMSGFSSISQFCRVFKQYVGYSFVHFRDLNREVVSAADDKDKFVKLMGIYFKELKSGRINWAVSFNDWLEEKYNFKLVREKSYEILAEVA